MNKVSAKEWLTKAWHNLSGAKLFYEADHYSDVTAVELHYAVEKSLKSFLAYNNQKIPKTHDLSELYKQTYQFIDLHSDIDMLEKITKYHIEESYPAFDRALPPRDEIKEVLDFAFDLFGRVCALLDIDPKELV